ncbi:hypothetical protein WUBG_04050 [Wuchereria bancrofti]|uniref:Uncharacterized protein n=1 Tax=Wuchereria bancrofti TaxID=6293 RepID=J9ERB0_WUCBA|nr:hypothetical protein WUBG_04050 [Wuchereria bancrofti]
MSGEGSAPPGETQSIECAHTDMEEVGNTTNIARKDNGVGGESSASYGLWDNVRGEERRDDRLVRLTARNIISAKFPSLRVGDRPSYPHSQSREGRAMNLPLGSPANRQLPTHTHTHTLPTASTARTANDMMTTESSYESSTCIHTHTCH